MHKTLIFKFSKIILFVILIFSHSSQIFSKTSSKATDSIKIEERVFSKVFDLQKLIENFKQYKTTNEFHSENLLQHSIWTGSAVLNWFETNDQWVKDIDKNDLKIAFIAALLHDVGKAGDLGVNFSTKIEHPQTGFEYLTNKKDYLFDKSQKFDFEKMFDSIEISQENRKLIAILAGIHEDFGKSILADYKKEDGKLFENFLKKLEKFVKETNYNNGKVDARLLRLALLISAADVKGAQKVTCSSSTLLKYLKQFNINLKEDLFDKTNTPKNKSPQNKYDQDNFEKKGKEIRSKLIYYFIKKANKDSIKKYVDWFAGTSPEKAA
jgi:hypothetical protein